MLLKKNKQTKENQDFVEIIIILFNPNPEKLFTDLKSHAAKLSLKLWSFPTMY